MSGPGSEARAWTGSSEMRLRARSERGEPLLGVRCVLGKGVTYLALLDTGAEWSVVAPFAAKTAGALIDDERVVMSTRHGGIAGHLAALEVRLVATEGTTLAVPACVFVPDRWPLEAPQVVLGVRGLLEQIAFAVSRESAEHRFWFSG